MKINVAKSAGFCFGVKRALKIALDAAKGGKKIEMFGDIVHNEEVVKEIENAGIVKIKFLKKGKNKTFLVRAHGAPAKKIATALRLGYKIIDATCPMVKEIHRIVKDSEKKGSRVVVIGDRNHDETIGIIGQLKNKALVIDKPRSIPIDRIKKLDKAVAVAQSTQNIENVVKAVRVLRKHIKSFKFFNTICEPTRTKQKEIKIMANKNNVMVIVGSKTSANTKRLYEISKSLNKRSFWIQSKYDIKAKWLRQVKSVGIAAGASTPDYTTKEVIDYIMAF